MTHVPLLRAGLLWLIFLLSFLLVLLLQPPLLYVAYTLTALGLLYLGFEARRLRGKPLPLHALARTIIRVGLALLTAAAILSLLDNVLVLANGVPALMAFSFFIEPLWILGALVAFGGSSTRGWETQGECSFYRTGSETNKFTGKAVNATTRFALRLFGAGQPSSRSFCC